MSTFTVGSLFCEGIASSVSGQELAIGRRGSRTAVAGSLAVNAATQADTFTLPTTKGTVSQFLRTDGAGNTSWATLSSGVYNQDLNTTSNVQFESVDIGGHYLLPTNAGTPGQLMQMGNSSNVEFVDAPDAALKNQTLSQFTAHSTSADLKGIITDTTGSGELVFNESPMFVTPNIGSATATSIDTTDSHLNLAIGPTANAINISKSGAITNIKGGAIVNDYVLTNEIDALPGPAQLNIGGSSASSVHISNPVAETFVKGRLLVQGQIDTQNDDLLSIGTNNTTGGVVIGREFGPVNICGSYLLPTTGGANGSVLTLQGVNTAWVRPATFAITFGGTNVASSQFFASNGSITSAGINSIVVGAVFVVPCLCKLSSVTIHALTATGSLEIYRNGSSQSSFTITSLKQHVTPNIDFSLQDELAIYVSSGPVTMMITCFFFCSSVNLPPK